MKNSSTKTEPLRIAVIGAGASGVFTALRAAEVARRICRPVNISVLEASAQPLKKVRISGGGRCNLTHHQFEVRPLAQSYPRGERELLSPFQRFQPQDTVNWFSERGVQVKAEEDGRMFPVSDSSQTVIDCFLKEAREHGVQIHTSTPVSSLKKEGEIFVLSLKDREPLSADRVVLATGSSTRGYELAQGLGHKMTELAPSLFTFKIKDPLLAELAGTSFLSARLRLKIPGEKNFEQVGPLLITHWGLSGPALLKLSAWAAREMKRSNYQATLSVNWLGDLGENEVRQHVEACLSSAPQSKVLNRLPAGLSRRFWQRLLQISDISGDKKCCEISKAEKNRLVARLHHSSLAVSGKSRFKEEFVECGGVDLREVDLKTMQSRVCKNLFLTGELLDVDGITGGFNFQHAWTSGWIAGEAMLN